MMPRPFHLCLIMVTLLAATAASPLTVAAQPADADPIAGYATEQVADGLYTFRWGAYRSLFMVTRDGVIATDPMNNAAAAVYRSEIARVTPLPVKYVVYSHSHKDRVTGGPIFKKDGANFVAQEKCAVNLRTTPWPDVVMPDITFSDRYSVELGGEALDLYYFGPSRSDCLIVMVPRGKPFIYTVDIAQPPSGWNLPFTPLMADFHFYNIVPCLRSVEALAAEKGITQVIGGYTSIGRDANGHRFLYPPAGPIATVTEHRQLWEKLFAVVEKEIAAGTIAEQVPNKVDLTQFQSLHGYDERRIKILLWRIGTYVVSGR